MTNTRWRPARTDLLEGKPRSVKTGRTVEDVAGSDGEDQAEASRRVRPLAQRRVVAQPKSQDRSEARGLTPSIRGAKPGALPSFVEPQLASLAGHPPPGDAWVHEIKFDGYRLLARVDRGRVTLKTRSGLDWTTKFPSAEEGARGAARRHRLPRRRGDGGDRRGARRTSPPCRPT